MEIGATEIKLALINAVPGYIPMYVEEVTVKATMQGGTKVSLGKRAKTGRINATMAFRAEEDSSTVRFPKFLIVKSQDGSESLVKYRLGGSTWKG